MVIVIVGHRGTRDGVVSVDGIGLLVFPGFDLCHCGGKEDWMVGDGRLESFVELNSSSAGRDYVWLCQRIWVYFGYKPMIE